jgi:hypothetical protein
MSSDGYDHILIIFNIIHDPIIDVYSEIRKEESILLYHKRRRRHSNLFLYRILTFMFLDFNLGNDNKNQTLAS